MVFLILGEGMTECKKIMVHSYKGGSGKTVTAIGLAQYFAEKDKDKVLLIEMDNRGPQFTDIFNVEPQFYINNFYSNIPLRDMIIDGKDISKIDSDNLSIVCAEQQPIMVPRGKNRKNFFMSAADRLRKQLYSLEKEDGYNYVIIDTPPGMDYSVINNFAVCDCIILLTRLDSSVNRTNSVLELLEQFHKKTVLLANLVPVNIESISNTDLSEEAIHRIEEWRTISKDKTSLVIPYTKKIAFDLFINSIPSIDGEFMKYIVELVNLTKD